MKFTQPGLTDSLAALEAELGIRGEGLLGLVKKLTDLEIFTNVTPSPVIDEARACLKAQEE
jgi:hypothetical protein